MPLCTPPAHRVPRRGVSAGCVRSSARGCARKPLQHREDRCQERKCLLCVWQNKVEAEGVLCF